MSTSFYDLPNDIIRLILDHYLPIKDIVVCFNTSKIFNVFNDNKLNIIKNAYQGHEYCIMNRLLDPIKYLYEKNVLCVYSSSYSQDISKFKSNEEYELYICRNYNIFTSNFLKTDPYINEYNDEYSYREYDFISYVPFYEHLFKISFEYDNLDITKWLYDMIIKTNNDINIYENCYQVFRISCQNNCLETSKWLYEKSVQDGKLSSITVNLNDVFLEICTNGYLEITKWLWEINVSHGFQIHESNLHNAFTYSCISGHIDVCKFLSECFDFVGLEIHMDKEYLFIYNCQKNNLEMMKWLYKFSGTLNTPIDIHKDNERVFIDSCSYGHFEIAKWLYQLSRDINSPINIHADNKHRIMHHYNYYDETKLRANNKSAFVHSCENNHFEVTKWLYQISVDMNCIIDIHIENECAFLYGCLHGNLEFCKWLYQLSIDTNSHININDTIDFAFKYSYYNNHIDICEWLCQLSLDHNCKIDMSKYDIVKTGLKHDFSKFEEYKKLYAKKEMLKQIEQQNYLTNKLPLLFIVTICGLIMTKIIYK